ncbi:hypothetical protein CKO15_02650 [Halorhodospira abdelmalekii]|uniref:hypothetical protein n=1 Tax=Halorhodospira abdelmalekii TaxID=421629 RepID=UPI0019048936|nr:hypothetical protein [Halorhodospira abdelmalekii]MBK1734199.1 hypothetical protein [Halorhodospira abdelmalekii]
MRISSASVLPTHATELFAAADYELARETEGELSYDSFRLGPVGARHGLFENFEYGASFVFVNNRKDDDGAPDRSGLEGATVYGKLAVSEALALELGARVLGDDRIFPYPSDGIDFYVNLPLQRGLGDGRLYGEIGLMVQDEIDGTSPAYLNWGIGYAHPFQPGTQFNVELFGDENPTGNNHMQLLIGAGFDLEGALVRPRLGIGVYDASPAVSLGADVRWHF